VLESVLCDGVILRPLQVGIQHKETAERRCVV